MTTWLTASGRHDGIAHGVWLTMSQLRGGNEGGCRNSTSMLLEGLVDALVTPSLQPTQ